MKRRRATLIASAVVLLFVVALFVPVSLDGGLRQDVRRLAERYGFEQIDQQGEQFTVAELNEKDGKQLVLDLEALALKHGLNVRSGYEAVPGAEWNGPWICNVSFASQTRWRYAGVSVRLTAGKLSDMSVDFQQRTLVQVVRDWLNQ